MQTLETSANPSARSDEALLNSAASSRPRSIAETISPPGRWLPPGHRVDPQARRREHVDRDAARAIFEALEAVGLGDRLLEPAERLGRHRSVGERNEVGADRCIQLGHELRAGGA